MITEATSPDFELYDSAQPVADESEYEKERAELWRQFCNAVRARADHAERLQLALDILGAVLDEPRLPADVLLGVLLSVASDGSATC
ncbi:MAG TPA: hypothetical protein VKI40_04010 [Terriglobales bacterium]|nr:hypothetical protein [Terriglobales bacterium]